MDFRRLSAVERFVEPVNVVCSRAVMAIGCHVPDPSWAAYERELSACAVLDPSLRSLKPSDTRAGIAVEMHPNVYEGRRADRNKDMARNPPPRCLYWRSAPISAPSTNAAKRLSSESRKSPTANERRNAITLDRQFLSAPIG
jgi:hypothetical protein